MLEQSPARTSTKTTIAIVGYLFVLVSTIDLASAALTREPYLQRLKDIEVTIMYQTDDSASGSEVCYGLSTGSLNTCVTAPTTTPADVGTNSPLRNHEVRLQSLNHSTTYFYEVKSGTTTLTPSTGASANDYFFVTAPPPGTATPFTIWVFGDSGSGPKGVPTATTGCTQCQLDVRNAMLNEPGAGDPDLILHVGDIAYQDGTDAEFTVNHFGIYKDILRSTPTWTALGNHEYNGTTRTGTGYYEAHALDQSGGSGSESYYSFDYANVHVISLDSMTYADDETSVEFQAMLTWLQNDLAGTTQEWVIAIWHHPPYSKGTHNSDSTGDSGGRLIVMREEVLPILEGGGVDLVLAGHSHVYERSYFIDGAHGYGNTTPAFSTLQNDGHIIDAGDGKPAGAGAYQKDVGIDGAVYVVTGNGGFSVANQHGLNHPVMYFGEAQFGSVLLDVQGSVLQARYLESDGSINDSFTIDKNKVASGDDLTTAYNDLAWRSPQRDDQITTITSPVGGSGLPSSAPLVNYATGLPTNVTLTVANGRFNGGSHGLDGMDPIKGDAYHLFDGKVSGQGAISYPNPPPTANLEMTFDGLTDGNQYDLAFFGDRGAYGWERASTVTLSGEEGSFVNNSSEGTDGRTTTPANPLHPAESPDSGTSEHTTVLPSDNPHGYVARFDDIDPGNDGQIKLTVEWAGDDSSSTSLNKGRYAGALMLTDVTGQSNPCNISRTIYGGQWYMVSVPCDYGGSATVQSVFGASLDPNDYDQTWVMWKWDPANDSSIKLNLSDPVAPGDGLWLIAASDSVITLSGANTTIDTSPPPGCVSSSGCVVIPLVSPASGNERSNMVGNPFHYAVDWADMRIVVDGQVYTPEAAEVAGFVDETIHTWRDGAYLSGTESVVSNPGVFGPGEAHWVKLLSGSAGKTVQLVVPARASHASMSPSSWNHRFVRELASVGADWLLSGLAALVPAAHAAENLEQQLDQIEASRANKEAEARNKPKKHERAKRKKPKRLQADEWYVRLIVRDRESNLKDADNAFGRMLESVNGFDRNDLKELPSRTDQTALSLVFPRVPADWGAEAGDYATDYRRLVRKQKKDEENWIFEVRVNPNASYRPKRLELTWSGPEEQLRRSQLIDPNSGSGRGEVLVKDCYEERSFPFVIGNEPKTFLWVYLSERDMKLRDRQKKRRD